MVTIASVHYDDDPARPYYTVRLADGSEHETVRARLEPASPPPKPDAAAATVQAAYRGASARRQVNAKREQEAEREQAVQRLQALQRGRTARARTRKEATADKHGRSLPRVSPQSTANFQKRFSRREPRKSSYAQAPARTPGAAGMAAAGTTAAAKKRAVTPPPRQLHFMFANVGDLAPISPPRSPSSPASPAKVGHGQSDLVPATRLPAPSSCAKEGSGPSVTPSVTPAPSTPVATSASKRAETVRFFLRSSLLSTRPAPEMLPVSMWRVAQLPLPLPDGSATPGEPIGVNLTRHAILGFKNLPGEMVVLEVPSTDDINPGVHQRSLTVDPYAIFMQSEPLLVKLFTVGDADAPFEARPIGTDPIGWSRAPMGAKRAFWASGELEA